MGTLARPRVETDRRRLHRRATFAERRATIKLLLRFSRFDLDSNLGKSVTRFVFIFFLIVQVLSNCDRSSADDSAPVVVQITDRIPFGKKPVDYFSKQVNDAVSMLDKRLTAKTKTLKYEQPHGYLKDVLKQLNVPVESQLLVYSKTARSPNLVKPQSPRAIYFNDEVSVAWIPEAKELEFTALDASKGVNFYTLSQVVSETPKSAATEVLGDTATRFLRRDRCLACHAGRSSLQVPGLLVRAFQTDAAGKPLFGFSQVTHLKKIADRFGGWFVSGSPQGLFHRGNLINRTDNDRAKSQPGFRASVDNLSSLTAIDKYATNTSDWIAHLVFTHQMHGLNLMIRANLEAKLGRRSDVEEQLVKYLVFAEAASLDVATRARSDRAQLDAAIKSSAYATWFQKQGRRDSQGRSLRDFDLDTRTFRYRLSFLIETRLFDQLDRDCQARIYRRLWEGLTSQELQLAFAHLDAKEKQAIIEIVIATKPKRPDYWKLPVAKK